MLKHHLDKQNAVSDCTIAFSLLIISISAFSIFNRQEAHPLIFVTRKKLAFLLTKVTFPNLINSINVQKKLSKTNLLQCVNNKHIIGCSNLGKNISFITSDQVLSEIFAPLMYMDEKEENQSILHLFTYKLKHKSYCSRLSL